MLKPSDKWNWYFDEHKACLMLDLGEEMIFQTNLSRKLLVNCAFSKTNLQSTMLVRFKRLMNAFVVSISMSTVRPS